MESWITNYCRRLFFFCFGEIFPDNSTAIFFSLWIGRLGCIMALGAKPHLFLGIEGSHFLADFLSISACSASSFQVWDLTARIWNLLCRGSCADMFEATWEKTCLQGVWERDCGISQCISTWILHLSGPSREACPWLPQCHPCKIEKGTGFSDWPKIDGVIGKASEPVKGDSLKSADE